LNRQVVIAFVGFALLVGVLFWLFDSDENYLEKHISKQWKTEYRVHSSDPRDIGFFQSLLEAHIDDSITIITDWNDLKKVKNYQTATYFFIGEQFGLESSKYHALKTMTEKGANVFLSFDFVTANIYQEHFFPGAYYWDYNNYMYAWVGDTTLAFPSVYEEDTLYTDWYTFDENAIKDTSYHAYSFALNHPIAFYETHLAGKMHFHSVPQLFQNYQVLTTNGYSHARMIVDQIPKDQPIIWLEVGRIQKNANSKTSGSDSDSEGAGNDKEDTSLIQFIMKSKGFREAFILTLLLLLLYVLFRGKRKEAVIPGVEEPRNMSLAFVETLSSIYLSRKSPIGILQVLRKNFYIAVSRHFYIDLNKKEEIALSIQRLSEKTAVDKEAITALVQGLDPLKNQVDNKHVSKIYRLMRSFYLETGIHKARKQYIVDGKRISFHKSILSGSFGLFIGFVVLFRGLQLLVFGAGTGVILVLIGALILFIASRILAKPMGEISKDQLIVYGFLFGKQTFHLNQGIQTIVTKKETTLYFEDGTSTNINHLFLSRSGKAALAQFIDHIKQFNA
jgi:hypothetical protein